MEGGDDKGSSVAGAMRSRETFAEPLPYRFRPKEFPVKQMSLSVKSRPDSQKGTAQSKRLRRDGFVPAEIYGHGETNLSVSVPAKEFARQLAALKGENALFTLTVEGGPSEPLVVLVKEIQYGRMDHSLWHCDFLKVKMNEKIRVRVPVRVVNAEACAGAKEGGTLQHFLRSLEVFCLPNQVPEQVEVDAAPLVIGASIHVSDLKVPEGVKVTTDPMTVVVMVAEQIAEEVKPVEAAAAAAPAEGAAAEPEVLTAKKKEEGEAAPAAGAKADAKKPAEKAEKK